MAEGSYIVWLVPACNCDIATYTRANDPPTATDPGLGAGRGFQPATRPGFKLATGALRACARARDLYDYTGSFRH